MSATLQIQILHFNDVYHITDVNLLSHFEATLRHYKESFNGDTVVIFSGDAYSPSLEASVLRGEHMVELLNAMTIDVACFGNHDFDFGEERLIELARQNNFPWTLTNAERSDGGRLANARDHMVKSVSGVRIGFFGLAGTDWPSNCSRLPADCVINSPVKTAKASARSLRVQEECDIVVALTHMRLAEDLETSSATADASPINDHVDLILGGHDHDVVCRFPGEHDADPGRIRPGLENANIAHKGLCPSVQGPVRIVKSGTDWRSLSRLVMTVEKTEPGFHLDQIELEQITDVRQHGIAEDKLETSPVAGIVSGVQSKISQIVQHPLWHTRTPLDGRSSVVRSQETALGSMLADSVRAYYDVDIAFVNSGGIRCNCVIEPSQAGKPLCVKDVISIVPFDNQFVVMRVPGSILRIALENSISDASTDGRFLHPSGLRFVTDRARPEGQRVLQILVDQHRLSWYRAQSPGKPFARLDTEIGPLDDNGVYTVAMVAFISNGFDGYTCFAQDACETVVDSEGAMTDAGLMLQIFGHEQERKPRDAEDPSIERARWAVVAGLEADGLPFVSPYVDGRICFASQA